MLAVGPFPRRVPSEEEMHRLVAEALRSRGVKSDTKGHDDSPPAFPDVNDLAERARKLVTALGAASILAIGPLERGLKQIGEFHAPALSTIQSIEAAVNTAVQECLSYAYSRDPGERVEYEDGLMRQQYSTWGVDSYVVSLEPVASGGWPGDVTFKRLGSAYL